MAQGPDFDLAAAHKYFSADCFNKAWELIDKPDRTPEEDEQMIRLSLASHWHWTQRPDCEASNVSVAHWQTSRIYAILGMADNARRYGQLAVEACEGKDVGPFYVGYAYEALARAESVAGSTQKMNEYLAKAREAAEAVPDEDSKKFLVDDLATIK